MVENAPAEPTLPTDATVLGPTELSDGSALVGESAAAPGAKGWRRAVLDRSGLVASVAVHLLLVLWAVGSFALAEKVSEDEVYPVTLVPAEPTPPPPPPETAPPPPPPEIVPDDIGAPVPPTPPADPAPDSPAKPAGDGKPADVPGFGGDQDDPLSDALAAFGMAAFDRPTTLSEDELGALSAQAKRCWNIPAGWTDPRQVSVTVRFLLNRDGTVNGTPTVVEFPASVLGKAAADDAVRAVVQCGPFDLPDDKYDQWNDVQLRFEP